jgi:hypothetical protein
MTYRALLTLLAAVALLATAGAAEPDISIRTSPLASVHLLATGRIAGGGAPDGMRFLFLVKPGTEAAGQFTLKETRDFTVEGMSYQQKTQAELGQRFEPGTSIDRADAFFSKQPGMRGLAPADITGGFVLVIAIGGAKIPADARVEVTAEVGFGKAVEPFTFSTNAPPAPVPTP